MPRVYRKWYGPAGQQLSATPSSLRQGRCLYQAYFNKTMKLVVSDKQKSVAFTAAWSPDGNSPPAVGWHPASAMRLRIPVVLPVS